MTGTNSGNGMDLIHISIGSFVAEGARLLKTESYSQLNTEHE